MSHEIIVSGIEQFKKRLGEAKLSVADERDKVNSKILGSWLVSQNINVNLLATPEEVADALYRATEANYAKLLWDVRPKALSKHFENEKLPNASTVKKEQEAFEARARAAENQKKQSKEDDRAQKLIDAAIESLVLDSVAKTKEYKVKIAAQASRNKQFGVPSSDVLSTVTRQIDALHETQERVHEIVGVPRSFDELLQRSLQKRGVEL